MHKTGIVLPDEILCAWLCAISVEQIGINSEIAFELWVCGVEAKLPGEKCRVSASAISVVALHYDALTERIEFLYVCSTLVNENGGT